MAVATFLERVKQGFTTLPVPEEQKESALGFLQAWLSDDSFAVYHPQIHALIEAENWSLLLDSFYQVIPFGTGGRRGAVGIGPNRINPYTIATSVQGHVAFLRDLFGDDEPMSVVIAYDVRCFKDLRGNYIPDQPNPLMGLTSKGLGQLAVEVYAAHGISSYMLHPDEDTYLSTPELSFLIREYGAQGGLNVSASHNHPDDNGGKFYNEHGGQPAPPVDQHMLSFVAKVKDVKTMAFYDAVEQGFVHWITPDKRERYLGANLKLVDGFPVEPIRVAYTPMHGTGSTSVTPLLEKVGHDVQMLPEQTPFDGAFTHVKYRMPNPEVRESMQDLIDFAASIDADIALATDPDADRIGMVAPDREGKWRFFTGNEIAAVLTHHRLQTLQERDQLPSPPIVVKTEVTTNLVRRITESFGGECLGGLLVGFKYIGAALCDWEEGKDYLGVKGTPEQFVIGSEESHGILVTPEIRDKDAAGAALLLAELASLCKSRGDNVCDYMERIYREHGYYCNRLRSMVMEGAVGVANIRGMQSALRENPPSEIAGIAVTDSFDFWDESSQFGSIKSETDRSSRNVLAFTLANNSRMVLRPSGTEPKAKLYVEVTTGALDEDADFNGAILKANAEANRLAEAFIQVALSKINIEMPMFALKTSDILSLDKKQHFASVLPQWVERTSGLDLVTDETMQSSAAWLTKQLASISDQPKGLLTTGFHRYLEEHDVEAGLEQTLRGIWDMLP